nr:GMC family oxidoreductase N-terminal domain-containing protein [Mycobacterium sp.]
MTDVLIVGAGSAGSVLAERLSTDPQRRVTVLEAGPGRTDPVIRAVTDDSAMLPIGPDSPVARHYRAMLTATDGAAIVRGAVVGGSGAINGGYFWRALPADFDDAPPGWSWAEVEPHYRAVEARLDPRPQRQCASSTAAFAAAVDAAGFAVAAVPLNIAGGRRRGPGAVFLEPVLGRPNLTVLPDTRVGRLVIEAGRVTGVEAIGPAGPVRIDADRVVLSAGAIESAHLLLVSGIGPAEMLAALGIPVIADLPVGRNCQDHPEWVLATDWPSAPGHPVLEAVLATGNLEIRPYTTGFGAAHTSIGVALMRPRSRGRLTAIAADPMIP